MWEVFFAEFFALCFTHCTQTAQRFPPVRLPPQRIIQEGYNFQPLNEPSWRVVRRTPTVIRLAKPGVIPGEAMTIDVQSIVLGSDGNPVSPEPPQGPKAARFVTLKTDEVPVPHRLCVRRYALAEDPAAPQDGGRTGPMRLELSALVCRHPRNPELGVIVSYTHYYAPGSRDQGFDSTADRVLGNLSFEIR